jgi:hypothetical protein
MHQQGLTHFDTTWERVVTHVDSLAGARAFVARRRAYYEATIDVCIAT